MCQFHSCGQGAHGHVGWGEGHAGRRRSSAASFPHSHIASFSVCVCVCVCLGKNSGSMQFEPGAYHSDLLLLHVSKRVAVSKLQVGVLRLSHRPSPPPGAEERSFGETQGDLLELANSRLSTLTIRRDEDGNEWVRCKRDVCNVSLMRHLASADQMQDVKTGFDYLVDSLLVL